MKRCEKREEERRGEGGLSAWHVSNTDRHRDERGRCAYTQNALNALFAGSFSEATEELRKRRRRPEREPR